MNGWGVAFLDHGPQINSNIKRLEIRWEKEATDDSASIRNRIR